MFVVDDMVYGGDTILHNKRHQSRKERDSYLLIVRKMDMEMSPDTLEVDGVNELFVTVTVDTSFTTEQTVSDSLGTHRERDTGVMRGACVPLEGVTPRIGTIGQIEF